MQTKKSKICIKKLNANSLDLKSGNSHLTFLQIPNKYSTFEAVIRRSDNKKNDYKWPGFRGEHISRKLFYPSRPSKNY